MSRGAPARKTTSQATKSIKWIRWRMLSVTRAWCNILFLFVCVCGTRFSRLYNRQRDKTTIISDCVCVSALDNAAFLFPVKRWCVQAYELCHVFILFVLSPCPNNHWLCSHPTCFEQWPDEVGCVTEPLLVIKPFDDEKLVRLLFNMRKREWRDGRGCVYCISSRTHF